MILFLFLILIQFNLSENVLKVENNQILQQKGIEFERRVLSEFFKKTSVSSQSWKENKLWLETFSSHCDWFGVVCDQQSGRVVELRLVNNSLSGELPTIVNELKELRILDLSGNKLEGSLNYSHFYKLENLELLDLGRNQFTSFELSNSPTITKTTTRTSEKREENEVIESNKEDKEEKEENNKKNNNKVLPKLKSLKLGSNHLQKLSEEFGKNFEENLEYLDLSSNLLRELPETISLLQNLTHLNIENNNYLSPFTNTWVLTKVRVLQLKNTYIGEVPVWVQEMKSLEEIDMTSSKLNTFPSVLLKVTTLKKIILTSNSIPTVPSDIEKLTQLQSFECLDCQMSSFPVVHSLEINYLSISSNPNLIELDVSFMTNLEYLGFSCKSQVTPQSFKNFTQLKTLLISNSLNELPKDIPESVNRITLTYTHISNWDGLENNQNLTFLELYNFENNTVDFPYFFASSRSQNKKLILFGNIVGTIPSSLSNFQSIEISGSSLEGTLPTEIGLASNLNSLVLAHNPKIVGEVPTELLLLSNLQILKLVDNSFNSKLQSELKSLNLSVCQLSQQLEQNSFSCTSMDMIGIEKICDVKCESSISLKGLWLMNQCVPSIGGQSQILKMKIEIQENGEVEVILKASQTCSNEITTSRNIGVLEVVSQRRLETGEYIVEAKFYRKSLELYVHNLAAQLYLNYACRVNFEIGEWIEILGYTCISNFLGVNASIISVNDCPAFDFIWKVDFNSSSMISVQNEDCLSASINPGSIELTREWSCEDDSLLIGCEPVCGDKFALKDEQCDDGNLANGDGCSSKCGIEEGWKCPENGTGLNEQNQCSPICGDNKVVSENDCDSFEKSNNDGNSTTELIWVIVLIVVFVLILVVVGIIVTNKNRKQKFLIPEQDITVSELLGEGKFGQVYKGTWRNTTVVAVKVLKMDLSNQEYLKEFLEEAQLYSSLRPHPNIVQFLGITMPSFSKKIVRMSGSEISRQNGGGEREGGLKIITEFIPSGNLVSWMRQLDSFLKKTQIVQLAKGISAGMDHLHQNNIIHRDLAARNILVHTLTTSGTLSEIIPKISDFGLATSIKKGKAIAVRWAAPEMILDIKKSSEHSDVWAFGVVLFEVITKCNTIPFLGFTNSEVVSLVLKGGHVELPTHDPFLCSIMESCFNKTPTFRPTFEQLHQELTRMESNIGEEEQTIQVNDEKGTVNEGEVIYKKYNEKDIKDLRYLDENDPYMSMD